MHRITKQFDFIAGHRLKGLPKGHPCRRRHGHNYIVELVLEADALTPVGFVLDYGDLGTFREYLATLDHRDLGKKLKINPTAENLARHFYDMAHGWWPEVVGVRVSETPKTWAEYWAPPATIQEPESGGAAAASGGYGWTTDTPWTVSIASSGVRTVSMPLCGAPAPHVAEVAGQRIYTLCGNPSGHSGAHSWENAR